jgi:hypothetical protein
VVSGVSIPLTTHDNCLPAGRTAGRMLAQATVNILSSPEFFALAARSACMPRTCVPPMAAGACRRPVSSIRGSVRRGRFVRTNFKALPFTRRGRARPDQILYGRDLPHYNHGEPGKTSGQVGLCAVHRRPQAAGRERYMAVEADPPVGSCLPTTQPRLLHQRLMRGAAGQGNPRNVCCTPAFFRVFVFSCFRDSVLGRFACECRWSLPRLVCWPASS